MVENCIELGHIANKVVPNKQRWSMAKLVDQFVSIIQKFMFNLNI